MIESLQQLLNERIFHTPEYIDLYNGWIQIAEEYSPEQSSPVYRRRYSVLPRIPVPRQSSPRQVSPRQASSRRQSPRQASPIVHNSEEKEECSICTDPLIPSAENGRIVIIPECAHKFHENCIAIWLAHNNRCPNCRTSTEGQLVRVASPRQNVASTPVRNVASTPVRNITEECPICIDPLTPNAENGRIVIVYPCFHKFHENCIREVRPNQRGFRPCPSCRTPMNGIIPFVRR
jgi:hypothetical protein